MMLVDLVRYESPLCRNISGPLSGSSQKCPDMIPMILDGTNDLSRMSPPGGIPLRSLITGLPLEPLNERPDTSSVSPVFTSSFVKAIDGIDESPACLAIGRSTA